VYDSYQHQDRGLTVSQRERIRKEREYERERELRLSRMSAEQRARFLSRESDRDISERIALGGTISAKDVNSQKNNEYLHLVSNNMSGSSQKEEIDNVKGIIKNIAKEVVIDK
jgi:SNW domain-containing protein 1